MISYNSIVLENVFFSNALFLSLFSEVGPLQMFVFLRKMTCLFLEKTLLLHFGQNSCI